MNREGVGREYVRVGESRPIPKTVDWANAPSVFKLYRGCPKVPLDGPVDDHVLNALVPLSKRPLSQVLLGQFLRDVYGLTRQRWMAPSNVSPPAATAAGSRPPAVTTLRPVPAGGARYPCELYLLAGPDQPIPSGVYHYDPAHHGLDVLRDTAPEAGLSLLITVAFWKNVFKYGEFSYRLHSLDAGVLLGQSLAVASRHGLDPTVHFQFADAVLDRLLGLDPGFESVYAVITLAQASAVDPASAGEGGVVAQPATPHPKSIGLYPLPATLHEVAMQQGGGPWPKGDSVPPVLAAAPASIRSVPLPAASLDLLEGLDRRCSSKGHFSPGTVSRDQLSALLAGSMRGYASDLGDDESVIQHTMLFGAVHNVEGIDSGVYYYDPAPCPDTTGARPTPGSRGSTTPWTRRAPEWSPTRCTRASTPTPRSSRSWSTTCSRCGTSCRCSSPLQRNLTCVRVPWVPSGATGSRRLINDIVLVAIKQ